MNTMDVRIKITQDIIKESDQFSDDSHAGELQLTLSSVQMNLIFRPIQ